jgi:hypothetical protein
MIKEELRELAQRDLDGDLTEKEQQRLKTALRGSDAARREYDELKGLVKSLSSVKVVDPPPHLENRIRASLRGEERASNPFPSWLARIREALDKPRPSMRFAAVFAGGLVVGALLLLVLDGPVRSWNVSDTDAAGSLAVQVGSIPIAAEGVKGTVNVARTPTGRDLTVNIISDSPAAVRFSYNPTQLTVSSVREIATSGGEMKIHAGLVEMTHSTLTHCAISFSSRGDADVELVVVPATGQPFTTTIPIHR